MLPIPFSGRENQPARHVICGFPTGLVFAVYPMKLLGGSGPRRIVRRISFVLNGDLEQGFQCGALNSGPLMSSEATNGPSRRQGSSGSEARS